MRLLHHGSGTKVPCRHVHVHRRHQLTRQPSLVSIRRHVLGQVPRSGRRNVHENGKAFLLSQKSGFGGAGRELRGRESQVPDVEEGVAQTKPLPVRRVVQSASIAFFRRPSETNNRFLNSTDSTILFF